MRKFKTPFPTPTDKAEAAPVLLAVADEASLPSLRAAALDWLVHNFPAAAATAGYRALSKQQTDQVAAAACALLQSCQDHLQVRPLELFNVSLLKFDVRLTLKIKYKRMYTARWNVYSTLYIDTRFTI